MRIILLTVFLIASGALFGQRTTVSGYLYDDDGEPLIGASVLVKDSYKKNGSVKGTVSDIDGYYILNDVDINDYLEVMYIGMETKTIAVREIIGGRSSGVYNEDEPTPSPELLSPTDALGVAYLTDKSPVYYDHFSISTVDGFKLRKGVYSFKERQKNKPSGTSVQFRTLFGIEQTTKLPELQKTYAQGRTNGSELQWYGPESGEIFSWGPSVNSLEYDGSSYPFDKNGRPVTKGTGNGNPVNTYDSSDFFGTGISIRNELSLKTAGFGQDIISFNLKQNSRTTPLPNSKYESYTVSAGIDKIGIAEYFTGNATIAYNYSEGDLLNRGSNLTTIMASVLTTPVTFDNANGLTRKEAKKNTDAYLLNNGSMRSYAPNYTDNPYALINGIDNENMKHLTASVGTKYKENREHEGLSGDATLSYEQMWDSRKNGTLSSSGIYPSQRISTLSDNFSDINFNLNTNYVLNNDWDRKLSARLSYKFNHQKEKIAENDIFSSGTNISNENSLQRNTHEIKYGAKFDYENKLFLEVDNRHYFSSTASSGSYSNWFPSFGAKFRSNLNDITDHSVDFDIFGSISRSLNETSLVYRNSSVLSTIYKASDFKNYYEYTYICIPNALAPETRINTEIGTNFHLMRNRLNFELVYFNNTSHNFIAPVMSGTSPSLQNVARIRNTGGTLTVNYYSYNHWRSVNYNIRLQASKTGSKVTSLYASDPYLPLAGFSDIATVLTEGKSVGVIYGSTYARNENGDIIIDSDGFPSVDPTMKMIGDPTPDFILNLVPDLSWRRFTLSLILEYKYGGDKWNGTGAALDYSGMSKNSGDMRNTTGHIFTGVTTSGDRNSKAVDFYDPSLPIEQNRWVRYGFSGVGEEYIEDATYFRLSDVSLSYEILRQGQVPGIKSLRAGFSAQNLLLITSRKGSDPTSALFGYGTGTGLDLFNLPGTRSYAISAIIEF